MKRFTMAATAVLLIAGAGIAFTDDGPRRFREFLNGLKEAPAIVSTTGNGTLQLEISRDEQEIAYTLTFSDLEGDVTQAHIHIGPPQGSGGIVLWLCQTAANPDTQNPETPQCTESDPLDTRNGRVTGVLNAARIRAASANGIAAGEFGEVIALIRAGKTYANVHSSKFGAGEIRSQIARGGGRDDHSGH
jgi:hypothetical protein